MFVVHVISHQRRGKADSLLHIEVLGGVRVLYIVLITITLSLQNTKLEKCRVVKKNSEIRNTLWGGEQMHMFSQHRCVNETGPLLIITEGNSLWRRHSGCDSHKNLQRTAGPLGSSLIKFINKLSRVPRKARQRNSLYLCKFILSIK